MVITAEQARILSKPKDITEKIEDYLDEIYSKIEESARTGKYNVSITLKPFASSYKESIFAKFRNDGYKVKFHTYNYFRGDCDEYFTVSWEE